jgi:hypothetical protein
MLVIAIDTLAVKMTLIFSQTYYLVVLMQCVGEPYYHREHQAEGQYQARNLFA